MPHSSDCNIVTCARDGQVRLAELSLTGVCKSTKKLAQHRGSAHKVSITLCTCTVQTSQSVSSMQAAKILGNCLKRKRLLE